MSETGLEYSRAGDGEYYTWAGRQYMRVTATLASVSGEYLMPWYAKMAALQAAAPLVHAGIFVPDVDSPSGAELAKFIDSQPIRKLDPGQAVAEAADWAWNMKAAERYRDFRANVGTIGHQAFNERALGMPVPHDLLEYVHGIASEDRFWPEDVLERHYALGKTRKDVTLDLAYHALHGVKRAFAFIEAFKPDFHASGMEAVAINVDEEYAGTMDGAASFKKSIWEAAGAAWPFGKGRDVALPLLDLKFTRKPPKTVRYQMAAYARSSFIGNMDTGEEIPHPEYDSMLCLWFYAEEGDDPAADLHLAAKGFGETTMPDGRTLSGHEVIDLFYEDFCLLHAFVRSSKDLPRAARSRMFKAGSGQAAPKRGSRPFPVEIGD